jgi:hypothetical protein
MKCWHCNNELIWGGDHDIEDDDELGDRFMMVSNLTCGECESFVLVYYPRDKQKRLN